MKKKVVMLPIGVYSVTAIAVDQFGAVIRTFNPLYTNGNCSGDVRYVGIEFAADWVTPQVVRESNGLTTDSLYLLARTNPTQLVTPGSFGLGNGTCAPVQGFPTSVVQVNELRIEDPTIYGLKINEQTNQWNYPAPLSIEAVQSEVISCDGFESCPAN